MTERIVHRMDRLGTRLSLALALAAVVAQSALGQATGPALKPSEATPQLPSFEVVAIKPSKSDGSSSHSGLHGNRFSATSTSLKALIQYNAYGIPGPQILGGPDWVSSKQFDIEGKADDATFNRMATANREQRNHILRQMFQQLLADRFKLAVHWETRVLPVYALAVANGGPKLTKSKDASGGTRTSLIGGRLTAQGVTMGSLAQTLTQILARELDRVVIDKTAIDGRYDLALTWSPENGATDMADTSNDASPPGSSIFTALKEQLGLKIESEKAPVDVLVIDHAEQPVEN